MITTEMELNAFSTKLRPWLWGDPSPVGDYHDHREVARCTVFGNKYTAGNEEADGVMSVAGMLLEKWPCDVHFAQYIAHSGEPVRCLKSDAAQYDLQFRIAAFDADFHGHTGDERPTPEAFATFVMSMSFQDFPPNYVYATRRGARVIFYIEAINNPEVFEAHYGALLNKLAEPARRATHGYYFDAKTKDWGRLFRCPLVVRDNVEEYHHEIRLIHTDLLDMRRLKVRQPKKVEHRPTPGNQRYTIHDDYLMRVMAYELVEGQRHEKLLKAMNYVYRKFEPEAAEQWIANLHEAAIGSDFDDKEFWGMQASARKHVEGGEK